MAVRKDHDSGLPDCCLASRHDSAPSHQADYRRDQARGANPVEGLESRSQIISPPEAQLDRKAF